MYKVSNYNNTGLKVNQSIQGQTLEEKIDRITTNNEPIKDGAPLIFTERNEGVKPGYNIRTDRFEIAIDAMDKMLKSNIAKSESKAKMTIVTDEVSGAEPTQGTGTDK